MLSQQHLVIEDQLCLALLNLLVNNGVHQPFMDGIRRFTQHLGDLFDFFFGLQCHVRAPGRSRLKAVELFANRFYFFGHCIDRHTDFLGRQVISIFPQSRMSGLDPVQRLLGRGELGVNGCIFLPLGNHGFGAQTGNQPHVLPLVERDF
ncbi:hypothetical protein D3C81_1842860 [compost metagenome]